MKQANTTIIDKEIISKPPLGDIEACARYVAHALMKSTRPSRTSAYIWVRFLKPSFLEGVK